MSVQKHIVDALKITGTVFLFWALASVGHAATYYCSPSGSWSTGDGSSGNPWGPAQNLYTVIPGQVNGGDTVICRDGYHGIINWNSEVPGGTGHLVIKAEHQQAASLSYVSLTSCRYIKIEGFDVWPYASGSYVSRNPLMFANTSEYIWFDSNRIYRTLEPWTTAQAWNDSCGVYGVRNRSSNNCIVSNNLIKHVDTGVITGGLNNLIERNTMNGWRNDGIQVSSGSTGTRVLYNTIKNVYDVDGQHNDFCQISYNDPEDIEIAWNVCIDFEYGRTNMVSGATQGIVYFGDSGHPCHNIRVHHNVLKNSHYHGISFNNPVNCQFYNNISIDSNANDGMSPGLTVNARVNGVDLCEDLIIVNNALIELNSSDASNSTISNNYQFSHAEQQTLFQDITRDNMRPRESATVLIDRGNSALVAYRSDIDGNGIVGSNIDIGAYEFGGIPVDSDPPVISSVTINPSSGTLYPGNTVLITVTEAGNTSGLTPSPARINGRQVSLAGQGNGTYTGTYTVAEGDNTSSNVEASDITLTGPGGTSASASSSGSTLQVIGQTPAGEPPTIASVTISPMSGTAKIGDRIDITVTAQDNLAGLTPSAATINGTSVNLTNQGDGTYTGGYVVNDGDISGINVEALNITLTGTGGTSEPVSSTGSTLRIDAARPAISSVVISPSDGTVSAGDVIDITVTAANGETGLVPTSASMLGNPVNLSDSGGGVYRGSYTIRDTDSGGGGEEFASDAVFTDNFESGDLSGWSSASSGIAVSNDAALGGNAVTYNIQSPDIKQMYARLDDSYDDSYTSFYMNLDNAFTMPEGSMIYVSIVKGPGAIPWATRLRRSGGRYELNVTLGAFVTNLGEWTQIQPGQWHWIKIHHRSASSGIAEWWLDGVRRGVYAGDTSGAETHTLHAYYLGGFSSEISGAISFDHFQMTLTDHEEPGSGSIEATGIILTDPAGNQSLPMSSSGSSLIISEAQEEPVDPPAAPTVAISPASGTRKVGSTVTITATAAGLEYGLTPSAATFNGKQIPLADQGDGTYTGTYTVTEGDNDVQNAQATGITLTGLGGTSAPASSSGSTLTIDANTPGIASVTLSPSSGTVTTGDTVTITVTAENNEAGLFASNAQINGRSIALAGTGGGIYTGVYTVAADDPQDVIIEAEHIHLTDTVGNQSEDASSQGSSLTVHIEAPASAPVVQSVTITPNSGMLKIGDSVTITVLAAGLETGLTPSAATFNGKQVPLTNQGDGTYVGYYSVIEGDTDASGVEARNITLTGAGGTSAPASSSGSTLEIDAHRPVIGAITLSPNSGFLTAGEEVSITVEAGNMESGLTVTDARINGIFIPLADQGNGYYTGIYRVSTSDIQGINIMASGIVLTDDAGNESAPGSSSGSTLAVDTRAPVIQSVALSPNTGTVLPGDVVIITVTAQGSEIGLNVSPAQMNNRTIPIVELSGGLYRGTYVVLETDMVGGSIEASGITLTDAAGNISATASSSGSSLIISTDVPDPPSSAPQIASVEISPQSGIAKVGDRISIQVTESSGQTGLVASPALINGKQIALTDLGGGVYGGVYVVDEGDLDGVNVEATGVTLSGIGGTSSSASSNGSTLTIDANSPQVSFVNLSPHTGWLNTGKSVGITVKATDNENGLEISDALINGVSIPLTDAGEGIYTGTYVVSQDDIQGRAIEATNIALTDAAGNISTISSSSGSSLNIDTVVPVIESVTIAPNSGTVTVGDEVRITVDADESGLIPVRTIMNKRNIPLTDNGDGTYIGIYKVAEADSPAENVEATEVMLRDAAGNIVGNGSSFGSSLSVVVAGDPDAPPEPDPVKPVIESVTLSPNSGFVRVGDMVTITVIEAQGLEGLTPSEVTFNNQQLPLADLGNGRYSAIYIVREGDFDRIDAEATNITLTGKGGTTILASSAGSNLTIDANTPVIHSVELIPTEVAVGKSVIILVTAEANESGLTPSSAEINGSTVQLRDQSDGTYRGLYTIQDADLRGERLEITGVTLTDDAGNMSDEGPVAYLTVIDDTPEPGEIPVDPGQPADTTPPQISSVTITPDTGWISTGAEVAITVTARNNETGLISSNAFINNEFIMLTGQGDGTYTGLYTVRSGDSQGRNIEAMGITLADSSGNVSQSASSFGSTLNIDTVKPAIQQVQLSAPAAKILGVLGTGQSVNIIVSAKNRESGLVPSSALINGVTVALADQGDGTYRGTYVVGEDDEVSDNVEATGITLRDFAGNISEEGASSNSGLSIRKTQIVEAGATDFNEDGVVSFDDFTMFILAYGKHEGQKGWEKKYDIDNSGDVSIDDFYLFVSNYGKRTGAAARIAIAELPQSSLVMGLRLRIDEAVGMTYADITVSQPAAVHGFEFALSYDNEKLAYDENSTSGLTGLSIPMFEEGSIRIASVFIEQSFGGTVTLGFRHLDTEGISGIGLNTGMLIETDGVTRTPEIIVLSDEMIMADTIGDLAVSHVSETFVTLNWTAPAGGNPTTVGGYMLELAHRAPDGDTWETVETRTLTIKSQAPGATETAKITGLKPGMPYSLALRPLVGGMPGPRSNLVDAATMVSFVDDDLDPEDPFIIRDTDSLFIADNDKTVQFEWSSWDILGASSYEVTVTAEGAGATEPLTIITEETSYVHNSQPGQRVSISVKPLTEGGSILDQLKSRAILCAPGTIEKPGRPNMVTAD